MAAALLSCVVGSGLTEREGLSVGNNLYLQTTNTKKHANVQKAGREEFVFYTREGNTVTKR